MSNDIRTKVAAGIGALFLTATLGHEKQAPETLLQTKITNDKHEVVFDGMAKNVFHYAGEQQTHVITDEGRHYIVQPGWELDTARVAAPKPVELPANKYGIAY